MDTKDTKDNKDIRDDTGGMGGIEAGNALQLGCIDDVSFAAMVLRLCGRDLDGRSRDYSLEVSGMSRARNRG